MTTEEIKNFIGRVDSVPTATFDRKLGAILLELLSRIDGILIGADKIIVLTQAQYDSITPDANTLYFIK